MPNQWLYRAYLDACNTVNSHQKGTCSGLSACDLRPNQTPLGGGAGSNLTSAAVLDSGEDGELDGEDGEGDELDGEAPLLLLARSSRVDTD